jgi:hypothetical protein
LCICAKITEICQYNEYHLIDFLLLAEEARGERHIARLWRVCAGVSFLHALNTMRAVGVGVHGLREAATELLFCQQGTLLCRVGFPDSR